MNIENGSVLMVVAISKETPTYIEFYRVDGILALRDRDGIDLSGHPGLDCKYLPARDDTENGWAVAYTVTRSQARKIGRWADMGLFVAVGEVIHRNQNGIPRRSQVCFSFRRGEKYLSPEDLAWLYAYRESSFDFTEKLVSVAAIASWIMFVAEHTNRPKKRRRIKNKERNRRGPVRGRQTDQAR